MSDLVEKVARAIWYDRHPGEMWTAEDERDYLGHARAAILAMREPHPDAWESLCKQFNMKPDNEHIRAVRMWWHDILRDALRDRSAGSRGQT